MSNTLETGRALAARVDPGTEAALGARRGHLVRGVSGALALVAAGRAA